MLRYQFWGFVLFTFALYAKNLVEGGDASNVALGLSGGGGLLGGALGLILAQTWKDRVPPIRMLLGSMVLLGIGTVVFGFPVSLAGSRRCCSSGSSRSSSARSRRTRSCSRRCRTTSGGARSRCSTSRTTSGSSCPALILSFVWVENDPSQVRTILVVSGAVFLVLTALVWRWSRSIRDAFAPQDDLVGTGRSRWSAFPHPIRWPRPPSTSATSPVSSATTTRPRSRRDRRGLARGDPERRRPRRERPEPDEWSVLECLGHVTDSELVVASRYRWIRRARTSRRRRIRPGPVVVDRPSTTVEDDPEALLVTFEALPAANLALWARSSDQDRRASATTRSAGPRATTLTSAMLPARHRFHLDSRPGARSRRSV
jgi:hypothetical protein